MYVTMVTAGMAALAASSALAAAAAAAVLPAPAPPRPAPSRTCHDRNNDSASAGAASKSLSSVPFLFRRGGGGGEARVGGGRWQWKWRRPGSLSLLPDIRRLLPSLSLWSPLEEEERDRRWRDLQECCAGNWSGSIGWYDVEIDGNNKSNDRTRVGQPHKHKLRLRKKDSFKLNMRMQFRLRGEEEDGIVGDWVVYHARGASVREAVELKYESDASGPSQFYSFAGGILGRTGKNLNALPVVEHGFWHDDCDDSKDGGKARRVRKTVVLAYGKGEGEKGNSASTSVLNLQKICFLSQRRIDDDPEYDVSGSDPRHRSALPRRHAKTLDWVASEWWRTAQDGGGFGIVVEVEAEALEVQTASAATARRVRLSDDEARELADRVLPRLFGHDEENLGAVATVRTVLPNGILVVCPLNIGPGPGEAEPVDEGDDQDLRIYVGCETAASAAAGRRNTGDGERGKNGGDDDDDDDDFGARSATTRRRQLQVLQFRYERPSLRLRRVTALWLSR